MIDTMIAALSHKNTTHNPQKFIEFFVVDRR